MLRQGRTKESFPEAETLGARSGGRPPSRPGSRGGSGTGGVHTATESGSRQPAWPSFSWRPNPDLARQQPKAAAARSGSRRIASLQSVVASSCLGSSSRSRPGLDWLAGSMGLASGGCPKRLHGPGLGDGSWAAVHGSPRRIGGCGFRIRGKQIAERPGTDGVASPGSRPGGMAARKQEAESAFRHFQNA